MVRLVLLILATVLFLLASFGVQPPRVQLGWLGLACLSLSFWFPHP